MDDCIFCKIAAGEAKSWKVKENDTAYAFLDIHPTNPYHTLVIPKAHYRDIFDIPKDELAGIMSLVKDITDLYSAKLGIQNVQIVNSSGAEAQQDVFHIHFHIVPRHEGDGQDVTWTTHPELAEKFPELLAKLN
ncbi:MAG: HIT domain-containing protein [bacterium]